MDIKDLPKVGPGFKASLNKPGTPSLQKSLGRLAIKNSAFRNLSKGVVIRSKVPPRKYGGRITPPKAQKMRSANRMSRTPKKFLQLTKKVLMSKKRQALKK